MGIHQGSLGYMDRGNVRPRNLKSSQPYKVTKLGLDWGRMGCLNISPFLPSAYAMRNGFALVVKEERLFSSEHADRNQFWQPLTQDALARSIASSSSLKGGKVSHVGRSKQEIGPSKQSMQFAIRCLRDLQVGMSECVLWNAHSDSACRVFLPITRWPFRLIQTSHDTKAKVAF